MMQYDIVDLSMKDLAACMVHMSKSSGAPVSPHINLVVARFFTTARLPQAQAQAPLSSVPGLFYFLSLIFLKSAIT